MSRTTILCLALTVSIGCAPPQESAPAAGAPVALREVPAEGVVLTNARVLDGNGGVLDQGSVVVRDGRIVSVTQGAADVPAGALVIDVQGRTVMPSYIDAHRHIIQGDPDQWMADRAEASMQEFIAAGFTTVVSAGDAEGQILELRRRTAEGDLQGPRIIAAARAPLAGPAPGGGGRGGADPARTDVSRPPLRPTQPAPAVPADATRARVQTIADAGFDAVKTVIIVTPGGPEQRTLQLVAEESRRLGLMSLTHAVTVQDTLAAVAAGTHVLAHTPHIGQLTEAQAKTIADAGIPMISTLGIFVPFFDTENMPIFRDELPYPWETISSAGQGPVNARLLWNAGLTYAFGTDTRYLPLDTLRQEIKSLFLVFSPQDIIRIMTRNSAAAIGRSDDLGTLETGKLADIVVLDGDPLEDIFDVLNVRMVLKEGRILLDEIR